MCLSLWSGLSWRSCLCVCVSVYLCVCVKVDRHRQTHTHTQKTIFFSLSPPPLYSANLAVFRPQVPHPQRAVIRRREKLVVERVHIDARYPEQSKTQTQTDTQERAEQLQWRQIAIATVNFFLVLVLAHRLCGRWTRRQAHRTTHRHVPVRMPAKVSKILGVVQRQISNVVCNTYGEKERETHRYTDTGISNVAGMYSPLVNCSALVCDPSPQLTVLLC